VNASPEPIAQAIRRMVANVSHVLDCQSAQRDKPFMNGRNAGAFGAICILEIISR
jgi:hypothetical protein